MLSDFVEELNIACDRIVGIQLFLPAAIHCSFFLSTFHPAVIQIMNIWSTLTSYGPWCDLYLKAPCCFVGDFNAALGKLGRPRGFGVVSARGRKLIEFLDYFNLVAINLFELTEGPLHSYMSDDERHKSDKIILYYLLRL